MPSDDGYRIKLNASQNDGRSFVEFGNTVNDGMNTDVDEARYNLATRIMSNGVEVIVASDKDKTSNKQNSLKMASSSIHEPITLAPSTLKDQMIMVLPTDAEDNDPFSINPNQFVTKTCLTTYTYLTTYLQDGTTTVESREKVISNTATEERNYLKATDVPVSRVTLSRTPELATGVFHTTYTYLNAVADGQQPLVVSSKHTVVNTITGPDDYISFLQPSEQATPVYETNTYYTPITMTRTVTESDSEKITSTSNILTQIVITESLPPRSMSVMTSYIALDAEDATEKVASPTKNPIVTAPSASVYQTATNADKSLHIYATKTYLTTFTYFTTLLRNNQNHVTSTVVNSNTRVIENVVTESIPNHMLDSKLLEKFRHELNGKYKNGLTTLATLVGGQSLEVTAMHLAKPIEATKIDRTQATANVMPTAAALHAPSKNVNAQNTKKPSTQSSEPLKRPAPTKNSHSEKPQNNSDDDLSDTETGESSYHEQIYDGTNNKNNLPVNTNDKTSSPVSSIMSSFNLKGLTAFGPVLNAMAGLIQNNLNSNRKDVSIVKHVVEHVDHTTPLRNLSALPYTHNTIGHAAALVDNDENRYRPPVYIPVQELTHIGAAHDQRHVLQGAQSGPTSIHISPPDNWPHDEKMNRNNKLEEDPTKATHEIPLLNGGIPISPGEVLTANSDIIIGRPGGVRPRIPLEGPEADLAAKGAQLRPNIIPLLPPAHHQTPPLQTNEIESIIDTFEKPPPPPPQLVTLQQYATKANATRHHPVKQHNRGNHKSQILEIKRMPEVFSTDLPATEIRHQQYQPPHVKTFPYNIEKPMLVNIKPSQTASVRWGHGSSASVYIVDNLSEPHKNGQYFDEPSPYPFTVDMSGQGDIKHNKHVPQTGAVETWSQKPILSNQQVNLDANVFSHNVDIHVPPITFKKESEFPHSTPVQGQRSPDPAPNTQVNMATLRLPYNKNVNVDLTPQHIVFSNFADSQQPSEVETLDSVSASSVSVVQKQQNNFENAGQPQTPENAQILNEYNFESQKINQFRGNAAEKQQSARLPGFVQTNPSQHIQLTPPKAQLILRTPNYYEGYKIVSGTVNKPRPDQQFPGKSNGPRNGMPLFSIPLPPPQLHNRRPTGSLHSNNDAAGRPHQIPVGGIHQFGQAPTFTQYRPNQQHFVANQQTPSVDPSSQRYENQLGHNVYVEPPNPYNNHLFIVHDYNLHETLHKDITRKTNATDGSVSDNSKNEYDDDEVVEETNSLPVLPGNYGGTNKNYGKDSNVDHNKIYSDYYSAFGKFTNQTATTPATQHKPQFGHKNTNVKHNHLLTEPAPASAINELHQVDFKRPTPTPFESSRVKPLKTSPKVSGHAKPTAAPRPTSSATDKYLNKTRIEVPYDKQYFNATEKPTNQQTTRNPPRTVTKKPDTTEPTDSDKDSGEIFDFKETMNPHNVGVITNLNFNGLNRVVTEKPHFPNNNYKITRRPSTPQTQTSLRDNVSLYPTTLYPFVQEPAVNMRPPPPPPPQPQPQPSPLPTPKTEEVMGLSPPPLPKPSTLPSHKGLSSLQPPLTSNTLPSLSFKDTKFNRYQPSETLRLSTPRPYPKVTEQFTLNPNSVPALYHEFGVREPTAFTTTTTKTPATTRGPTSTSTTVVTSRTTTRRPNVPKSTTPLVTTSETTTSTPLAFTPTIKEKKYSTISRTSPQSTTETPLHDDTNATDNFVSTTANLAAAVSTQRTPVNVTRATSGVRTTQQALAEEEQRKFYNATARRTTSSPRPTHELTRTSTETTPTPPTTPKVTKPASGLRITPTPPLSSASHTNHSSVLISFAGVVPDFVSENVAINTAEDRHNSPVFVPLPSLYDVTIQGSEESSHSVNILSSEVHTPLAGNVQATPTIEGTIGKRVKVKTRTKTVSRVIPTKYITNSKTLTVTTTDTTVVTSPGISTTETLTLTTTRTSTIIDTITETIIQTLTPTPHLQITPQTTSVVNLHNTNDDLNSQNSFYHNVHTHFDEKEPSLYNYDDGASNSDDSAENVNEFVISYEDNFEREKTPVVEKPKHPVAPSTTLNKTHSVPTRPVGDNDSIFVVMTDKKTAGIVNLGTPSVSDDVNPTDNTNGNANTNTNSTSTDPEPEIFLGGVGLSPSHKPHKPHVIFGSTAECRPDCKASRNELCQTIEGATRCICRPGFARMFPDRPCKPTYTYSLKMPLERYGNDMLEFNEDMSERDSESFYNLAGATHEALDRMVMQSDFRDIYHGVHVTGFEKSPRDNGIVSHFYLQLSDNSDETRLVDVFKKYLRSNNFSVGRTEMYSARSAMDDFEASDFNECLNSEFHDCSDNALCFNLHGTYTCSCKEGYADVSENPVYPGRICSAQIEGCEKCNYHGTCLNLGDDEPMVCECFPWYGGISCQVNLKILLIALVALGTMLLILLFFCVLVTYSKRRKVKNVQTLMSGINIIPARSGKSFGSTLKVDKRPMIKDSSSDISHNTDTLPYPPRNAKKSSYISAHQPHPIQHHEAAVVCTANRPQRPLNQADRAMTVMIPRAKYHPVSHCTGSHLNLEIQQSHSATETKLLSYLDAEPQRTQATRRNTSSSSLATKPPPPPPVCATSTGALISAGFEVSATVNQESPLREFRAHSLQKSNTCLNEAQLVASTTETQSQYNYKKTESSYIDTMDDWLDEMQQHDLTVSEARSYDETTIRPTMKSLRSVYEKQLSQLTNDEANTMAERDIGSTFLLPHTHLYKPDRGSDMSGFDSF